MGVLLTQRDPTRTIIAAGLALSVGLHVMAYASIPVGLDWARLSPLHEVDVVVVPPEPAQQPTEEPTEEPPEAEPVAALPDPPVPAKPEPRVHRAPPQEPAAPAEEPPAQEAPVRFDNVTLTNEGMRSSWAMDPGSGRAADGPLAAPGRVTGRARTGVAGGTAGGTGPRIVPLADLSRAPVPPGAGELNQRLERVYKGSSAWKAGVTGVATVRTRIDPDGSVASSRIVSETVAGYELGELCQRALRGTRWQPPLDQQGRAVATWVTFNCDFRFR
jgi:TonB family protein